MAVNLSQLLTQWQSFVAKFTSPKSTQNEDTANANTLSLKAIAQYYPNHGTRGQLKQQIQFQPTDLDNQFIGRESKLKQIEDIIDRWRQHQGELSAIIAPFGAGLSSFMSKLFSEQQEDEQILWLSFYQAPLNGKDAIATLYTCFNITEEPSSLSRAISLINAQTPRVVLIDDIHTLMFRVMGNYHALVTIANILTETRQQHNWVLGCDPFVWHRLKNQYQIAQFVKNIIEFNYFHQEELHEFISIHLPQLGLLTPNTAPQKTTDSSDTASDINSYVGKVMQIAQGHPKLTLLLLQDAIDDDDSTLINQLNADNIRALELHAFNDLNEESLFALAEIYVHGGLTIKQLSQIFNTSIEKSSLTLEHFSRLGLLIAQYSERDFADHYYRITPTLTHIVAKHLVTHNKLYK